MPEDKKNNIGPNRPFDPTKETMDDYELNAVYPIFSFGNVTPSSSKPIPPDMGDEALVGALYENKKDSPCC